MKKLFYSFIAIAVFISCSESNTKYEELSEIGFSAVAGNITKAAVDGAVYPTGLNIYIFAETSDNEAEEANFIRNAEFTCIDTTGIWGGGSSTTSRNPYFWPNVKTLHFSGYSKSGNATQASYTNDLLSITDYNPGTSTAPGENDLMWFPSTKLDKPEGYDKNTVSVPVNMYHTCSWISFLVKGDNVTGAEGSTYKVDTLTINGIDMTANLSCSASISETEPETIIPNIEWRANTDQNENYPVTIPNGGIALSTSAKNVETNEAATNSGNIVLIPQTPGTISLSYSYTTPAGVTISETATELPLRLSETDEDNLWLPGIHYIYTITIKANEILIAPTPNNWTGGAHDIIIE